MTATTVDATATDSGAPGVGRVARVIGPVVDIEFPSDQIPDIYNALQVDIDLSSQGEGEQDGVGAVRCRAVVLASGGLGQVYSATTNPSVATADGSADVHFFRAGMAVAARRGLQDRKALKTADKLYASEDGNQSGFEELPTSCDEVAKALQKDRKVYEEHGVFPTGLIDSVIDGLKSYDDSKITRKLKTEGAREELIQRHLHVG